jgi:hypothetical protein
MLDLEFFAYYHLNIPTQCMGILLYCCSNVCFFDYL